MTSEPPPIIETMTEDTSQIKTEPLTKEIIINKLTSLTGDRTQVQGFVQVCLDYLQLNKHIYTSDEAKVTFVLSFLTDKEALKWKETYLATIWDNHEGFKYPTFKDFLEYSPSTSSPLIRCKQQTSSWFFETRKEDSGGIFGRI